MSELPATAEQHERGKRNALTRFLDGVEWLGNLLPHPVTLFAILAFGIVLLSGLPPLATLCQQARGSASPRLSRCPRTACQGRTRGPRS